MCSIESDDILCDCVTWATVPWEMFWQCILTQIFRHVESWSRSLIFPAVRLSNGSYRRTSKLWASKEPHMSKTYNRRSTVFAGHQKSCVLQGGYGRYGNQDAIASCTRTSNGGSHVASLFMQQGWNKEINQDAMLVWENFASQSDTVFCSVLDGHGLDGHAVALSARDMLPSFLECMVKAFKLTDGELLVNDIVDSVSSGTTAVAMVKQGNDLIIGNAGDSRAVLGTRSDDGTLLALQLTTDCRANVPREAERIRSFGGRIFALDLEQTVQRVWLPHVDTPGLAVTRALGDFCIKDHGVVSDPEVTHHQLSENDKFVVLATDGVWDVLSNEQVVEIVASAEVRSSAAEAVVETALDAWRFRSANSKADDCAVVCLFFD